MKNTTDNIQNTNRGSNGGQTTISGASNPHKGFSANHETVAHT